LAGNPSAAISQQPAANSWDSAAGRHLQAKQQGIARNATNDATALSPNGTSRAHVWRMGEAMIWAGRMGEAKSCDSMTHAHHKRDSCVTLQSHPNHDSMLHV
jgi:hypothetical protein